MNVYSRDPNRKRSFRENLESVGSVEHPSVVVGDIPLERMANPNPDPNAPRTMRDFMNPMRTSTPSCIVIPEGDDAVAHFNIKPGTLQSLPHFHGEDKENPYLHIKEFEEMVNTFCNHAAQLDVARMRLFPFSLKDKAKIWFNGLRSQSVRSWAEMQEEFFKKFFPIHRTTALKGDIQIFEEKDGESFNGCWNRYKDCLNAVPHHGYSNWEIVHFFYQEISFKTRQFIELMCNGTYLEKEPTEALE